MRTISESVYELLMAQGLRTGSGATETGHGMEKARRSRDGAAGQVYREVSVNAQEPSPSREVMARPVLRLVVSNKDGRARPKASIAQLGARPSLLLVR